MLRTTQDGVLGLRLGEMIGCPHSLEKPAGCGTTPSCRYCGVAQAIAKSMTAHVMDVRECHVESGLSGESVSLDLRVSAAPFDCPGESFTVCVLRDITDEKRRQVLERVFFDDILQAASMLKGMLEIPGRIRGDGEIPVNQAVRSLARQVVEEIQSQQDLVSAEAGQLAVRLIDVNVVDFLHRLCAHYRDCSVCDQKRIVLAPIDSEPVIWTDEVLLGRVLGNLIKNALEASEPGQTVTLTFEHRRHPLFSIHNDTIIPEACAAPDVPAFLQHQGGSGPRDRYLQREAVRREIPQGRRLIHLPRTGRDDFLRRLTLDTDDQLPRTFVRRSRPVIARARGFDCEVASPDLSRCDPGQGTS